MTETKGGEKLKGREGKRKFFLTNKKWILISGVSIVGLMTLAVIILIPFAITDSYVQYYYSHIRCAGSPIAVSYNNEPYKVEYSKPGDVDYPKGPGRLFTKYVCTEQEAKDLGAQYNPTGDVNY